jgi:hypothetical protein
VSYQRGAVTAAIALTAIVGSTPLISNVVSRRVAAAAEAKMVAAKADDAAKADEATTDVAAQDPAVQEQVPDERGMAGAGTIEVNGARGMAPFNMFQFISMAVGTFIAYEFGRGTGAQAPQSVDESTEPVMTMDPTNLSC